MKINSPKGIALVASLVISFVSACITIVVYLFYDLKFSIIPGLITVILAFVVSYLVYYSLLEHFIYKKLKILYKSIHSLKITGKKDIKLDMGQDVLQMAGKEIAKWAGDQHRLIEKLREESNFRNDYMGNVAHELKTPLFSIQGYILTLLEGGLEDKRINRNYLLKAEKNIERMIRVIEDLDMISRLESGEVKLSKGKFDLLTMIKEVIRDNELFQKEKNSKVIVQNKTGDDQVLATADMEKIRQVLTNLLINSLKYGKKEGKTEFRVYDLDEHLMVEVSDDGPGIPKSDLPRIFERFYRVEKSRSRNKGGTGIGLAIVKHILEAHQQTINVRSSEGVGTTFSFTLDKAG